MRDDLWLGTNVHLLVILQNTKLIPADAGPKRWDDLLDPKWKGKIAFTDPANSGSAYSNLTMLAQLWGNNDAAWDKVAQLLANTKVLNRSTLVFQGVGNGEFALGMSLEYAGYQWSSNGAPVKVIYPQDGTIAQMEGVAIIKGGPNAENAKAFADYVSRKDMQGEDPGLCVPPRCATAISTSPSCRGKCRSSPTSNSSIMTRTPGWRSAPRPRRRSRTSSGGHASVASPTPDPLRRHSGAP